MKNETHHDIVIVDSDERYRMFMCRGIEAAGYRAGSASDATSACALIALDRPSLAVIDMNISGKSAIWLASRLTSLNPRLQIVFTARSPEKLELIEQSSLPFLSLLRKPLDHSDILPILQAVILKRSPDQVHETVFDRMSA